jgi:hypothetical protein
VKRTALAVLLGVMLATLPPNAGAQPAPTGGTSGGGGLLSLDQPVRAIEPDGDLQVQLRVAAAPPGAELRVTVYDRTTTRSAFQQTLDGKSLGRRLSASKTFPATPDATGIVPITIGTRSSVAGDPTRLRLDEGVYPISVELVDGTDAIDELVAYAVRLRSADQGPPLGVAVVVPVGASAPSLQPDGTTAVAPQVERNVVDIATVLVDHATEPVTLAVDPETVDALTATGDVTATSSLRAAAAGRQVAAATYVPVDLASSLAAGMNGELGDEVDRGIASLADRVGTPSSATWISADAIDQRTAEWLRDRHVRRVVLPDSALSAVDTRRFPATLTQPFRLNDVDGVRAVAADEALAAHLGETGDDVLDANHLLADLAILDLDRPQAARLAVVAFPADKALPPTFLDPLLAGLHDTRTLRAGTVDDLLAAVPDAGSRGEVDGKGEPLQRSLIAPSTSDLGNLPSEVQSARDDIASYQTAVEPSNPRPAELKRRTLVAGHRALGERARSSYLDGVSATIRGELAKIQAPPRQSITFTARDGVVGLTVRNTAGYPMHVVLALAGPRLEFPSFPSGVVPLTATGDAARVELNVRARSSGDAALDVTIETPDRRVTIARTRVTVRSTAFSGVGVVLSGGAIVFLLLWWGRHTLAARRARRAPPRHAAGD